MTQRKKRTTKTWKHSLNFEVGQSRYVSFPPPRTPRRCCKHHRRIHPRDLLNQPIRHKDGSLVSIALPRGKAYPYSSTRQDGRAARQRDRFIDRTARLIMREDASLLAQLAAE